MQGKVIRWAMAIVLASAFHIHAKPAKNTQARSEAENEVQGPPVNKLDTTRIHKTYLDGDFEMAIELIEDAMKYGGQFSHQDSIFILKHLGVMHTARYETREKGKRYLMELLNVEPTAKIMDMYASDMIYMIFKNIRDEFETANPHRFSPSYKRPQTHADNQPDADDQPVDENPRPKKKSGYAWVGWTLGAITAAGGVALYVHMAEEQKSSRKENLIQ